MTGLNDPVLFSWFGELRDSLCVAGCDPVLVSVDPSVEPCVDVFGVVTSSVARFEHGCFHSCVYCVVSDSWVKVGDYVAVSSVSFWTGKIVRGRYFLAVDYVVTV